jgi:hypothetical protein
MPHKITLGKAPKKVLEIEDLGLRLEIKARSLRNTDEIEDKISLLRKQLNAGEIKATDFIRESLRMVLVSSNVSWAEDLEISQINQILQAITAMQLGETPDGEDTAQKKTASRKNTRR